MLKLDSLKEQLLLPGTKGLALTRAIRQADVAQQAWQVFAGDTSFPVALLKQSALEHNAAWMKQFCARAGLQIAPHGKTTMSPQLFDLQLKHGAWGMSFATVNQCWQAHRFGVKRMLLANQIVHRADALSLFAMLQNDTQVTVLSLVDSQHGVQQLNQWAQEAELQQPLPLLLELGFQGGRTGCRSVAQALEVAHAIARSSHCQLVGVEAYEGLLVSQQRERDIHAVHCFLDQVRELAQACDKASLFESPSIYLSAGGSAYFDLVGRHLHAEMSISKPITAILRSGCYITHDHGFYAKLIQEMHQRDHHLPQDSLRPALEVWSMVQSRPEPDLAILTMGKRDASYDIDLPLPLWTHRPSHDQDKRALARGCKIEKMNDQHAYLRLPAELDPESIRVGDLIGCGISHPCTTFDKWSHILVVDDAYRVLSVANTFF